MGIAPSSGERHEMGKLPQHFADMFGWEELVQTVAEVYHSLPPEEQAVCGVYGRNYGEAGAIDLFSEKYDIPKAVSGHNSYWLWGPRDYTGEMMIVIGGEPEDHTDNSESVTSAAIHTNEYAMPYENNLNIFICRGLKWPLEEVWQNAKHYN